MITRSISPAKPSDEGEIVTKNKSILENLVVLLVLGVLAGAIGGLGIGVLQLRALQAASSSAAGK